MLDTYLLIEIEYLYNTEGLELSHICEMKKTFITELRFMTYDHYKDLPKHAVEWNLIGTIHENRNIIRSLQKTPDPVVCEYDCYLYSDSEDEDGI